MVETSSITGAKADTTAKKGVADDALIRRDGEQAEIALAGRPGRVVTVNCRGDAFPREQGESDISNLHWASSIW
jgi:hypothetical protein